MIDDEDEAMIDDDEDEDDEALEFGAVEVTFKAWVEVFDREELYKAAVTRAQQEGTLDLESIREMLGTEEDPDVASCVQMMMDPGVSPPGTVIVESSCGRE